MPASGPHRGDEDRRGQDPDRHPARLPERPDRRGRPHRHCQRLPGHAATANGWARSINFLGLTRGPDRARHGQRPAPRRLRLRHHLRHQQRDSALTTCATTWSSMSSDMVQRELNLRHRGRGGLHPHRRGAHAADHLRPGRQVHRPVREGQSVRQAASRTRSDYTRRRKGKGRHPHRAGRRQGASSSSTWKTSPTWTTPSFTIISWPRSRPTPS